MKIKKRATKLTSILMTAVIMASFAFPGVHIAAESANLFINSGFESGIDGWTVSGNGAVDSTVFHSGVASLKLNSDSNPANICNTAVIDVDTEYKYRLSVWIKTDGITADSVFSINVLQGLSDGKTSLWYGGARKSLCITDTSQDWTQYSVILDKINLKTERLRIYAWLDKASEGSAWVDDFELEKLEIIESDRENGAVEANTVIHLIAPRRNADLYYTDDGSAPAVSPTRKLYPTDAGLIITGNTVIKAVSCINGVMADDEQTFSYTCSGILSNPGFENGMTGWGNEGSWAVDTSSQSGGENSAFGVSRDTDSYIYTAPLPVNAAYRYRLSVMVKTENIITADGFSINIVQGSDGVTQGWYGLKIKSLYVTGFTQDWTRYSVILDGFYNAEVDSIRLYARLDGGCGGSAWVDDFELTALQNECYPVEQVEINTKSVQGNIYTAPLNTDISYSLKLNNRSRTSHTVRVNTELFDDDTNSRLSESTGNVTIASLSAKNFLPDISAADKFGCYRLDITVSAQDGLYSYKKSYYFSRISHLPTTGMTEAQRLESGFGSAVHLEQWNCDYKAIIDEAVLAGNSWIRDGMRWYKIEKDQKGVYDFPEYWDNYFNYAKEKGIKICLALSGGNTAFYGSTADNYVPVGAEQVSGFANFAAAVAQRYGDSIYAFEIFNEWNGSFNPGGATAEDYAELLKAVYPAVKAVDSDMKIVCGATSGCDIAWLKRVFDSGGYNYCDIVSVHPYILLYAPERNLSSFSLLKTTMASYGELKPIWLTEFGYSTFKDSSESVPGYQPGVSAISQPYAGCDDKTAAVYASRVYTLLQTGCVDKVFWYCLINKSPGETATESSISYNKEMNFGLCRSFYDSTSPLSAKSPLVAVNAVHTLLNDSTYTGREDYTEALFSYRFTRNADNSLISMLCIAEKTTSGYTVPVTVTPTDGLISVYDMYGNLINTASSPADMVLSAAPVFISGSYTVKVNGNLITNCGFESGGWPSGYGASSEWTRDTGVPDVHSGNYAVKAISNPLYIGQKWAYIPVDSNGKYLYSVWIKSEDVTGATVKFREAASADVSGTWFGKTAAQGAIADASNDAVHITGTNGWKRYTFVLRNFLPTTKYVKIYCSVDKGSGTAWFDDVSLTDITDLQGDVNDDGERNIFDLVRLKKYIAGKQVSCSVWDFDESGSPDAPDIVMFRRMLICS